RGRADARERAAAPPRGPAGRVHDGPRGRRRQPVPARTAPVGRPARLPPAPVRDGRERRAPRAPGRARTGPRGGALPVRPRVSDTTPMLDLSGLGVRDAEAREAALAAFGDALLGA